VLTGLRFLTREDLAASEAEIVASMCVYPDTFYPDTSRYPIPIPLQPKPFIWTKSAQDILQKVIRANSKLSSKQNAALH